jgi:hypothetical protein
MRSQSAKYKPGLLIDVSFNGLRHARQSNQCQYIITLLYFCGVKKSEQRGEIRSATAINSSSVPVRISGDNKNADLGHLVRKKTLPRIQFHLKQRKVSLNTERNQPSTVHIF